MAREVTRVALAAMLVAFGMNTSRAQSTVSEDFSQAATTNNWYYYNGACLTAGTGPGTGTASVPANPSATPPVAAVIGTPGSPPSCVSIFSSYYAPLKSAADPLSFDSALVGGYNGAAGNAQTLPDNAGQGALRFTNGSPYGRKENGAIVSATPFNAQQGLQVSFKTVSYRGTGADGMSFFLIDATKVNPGMSATWNGIGSFGGSLGYSCSNNPNNLPDDGLVGAYLGLGIDEFGNFLTQSDNTATGTASAVANRIGLRGAGSVSWAYLNATYPKYYPAALLNTPDLQTAAVRLTCQTRTVWDFTAGANPPNTPNDVEEPSPRLRDYAAFGTPVTLSQIASDAAGVYSRPQATPLQFNLNITPNGLLTVAYSTGGAFSNIVSGYDLADNNLPLPNSLYFGFAGSSGGMTNIHEIMCFKAGLPATSSSSAAVNQQLAAKVASNAQVYFSYYIPSDWTGTVTANGLVDTAGVLSINAAANWDAQCVLTGGTGCASTGSTATTTPAPAPRVMLTWNGNDTASTPGTAGIPFAWPSSTAGITPAEETVIDAGDPTPINANRLNYLRGDRSNEVDKNGNGLFRARDGLLGDIVDSSPAWVGPPLSPYIQVWKDRYTPANTMPENSGQSYATFKSSEQSRLNVVYVGANDGFLHAFRTGSEDASGNLIDNAATPNDGQEVLAYMPGAVLQTLHNAGNPLLDPTAPSYAHNFFVDATPGTGDVFYGGAWHTWLIGGLGPGGSAIYALDVTDPTAAGTQFAESNAAAVVKGEWGPATISCTNTSSSVNAATCGTSLGNTYGTPLLRRFHNGTWGAIFGNGFGSATGDAGIFVMTLDPTAGAGPGTPPTFYYLSAGVGTAAAPGGDGIAYATAADLDGDHITDYVYAGDLKGNVWRFDLTDASPSNWSVSGAGPGGSGPIFTTVSGQPITTPVIVASAPITGSGITGAILVSFGTGQRTQITSSTPIAYAPNTQSLYTVWDWNFGAWNSISAAHYMSLTPAQVAGATGSTSPFTLGPANLQVQTLTVSGNIVDTSNTPITWEQCISATSCTTGGSFGWYANLPGSNEQIVSPISLVQQALTVNSTIPGSNALLSCDSAPDTGFTYVISMASGGTFTATGATTPASGFFSNNKDANMVGLATNLTGALTVVNTAENTSWLVGQATNPGSGTPVQPVRIQLPTNVTVARQTWVQLR